MSNEISLRQGHVIGKTLKRSMTTRFSGAFRHSLGLVFAVFALLIGARAGANGDGLWQLGIDLPPNQTAAGESPAPKLYFSRDARWEQLVQVFLVVDGEIEKLVEVKAEIEQQAIDLPPARVWRRLVVRLMHKSGGFFIFRDWCPSAVKVLQHGPNRGPDESTKDGRPMVIEIGADDHKDDHDFDDVRIFLTYDNADGDLARIDRMTEKYKVCG